MPIDITQTFKRALTSCIVCARGLKHRFDQECETGALFARLLREAEIMRAELSLLGQKLDGLAEEVARQDTRIAHLESEMKGTLPPGCGDLLMYHNRVLSVLLERLDPRNKDADLDEARSFIDDAEVGYEKWGAGYVF